MNFNTLAIGRNILTADTVQLKTFNDGASVWFDWADGAHINYWFDSKGDALEFLSERGYAAIRPLPMAA